MNIKNLLKYSGKPEIYEKGKAEMWTDEYISKQLLAMHLNDQIDLASRKPSTINKTVRWILDRSPGEALSILDLGCGPGLYTEQFASYGHRVTGVDFSKRSIHYAAGEAKKKNLNIEYIWQNYLKLNVENQFDLVMMIYTDFGVLAPPDRQQLLSNINKVLKPGGILIFDVLNDQKLDQKVTPKHWEAVPKGFWKNEPYLLLMESFLYREEKVILSQYVLVDEHDDVDCYRFWSHYFSDHDLRKILNEYPFENLRFYRDVLPGGDLWDGDNVTFCVCTKES